MAVLLLQNDQLTLRCFRDNYRLALPHGHLSHDLYYPITCAYHMHDQQFILMT